MPQFVTIKAEIKWFLKSLMYFICGCLIFCSILMFLAWRAQPGINDFFPDGQSWLHHAASWNGSVCDMKWYLFWGADINLRGVNDMTPIFYAVKDDKLEHVKFLYQKGADIHLRDSNGFGLIHYASSRQMLDYLHEIGLAEDEDSTD